MSLIITVLLVLVAAVCGALGFYLGGENRKRTAEAKIGSAEDEAKRIVNDAIKTAEAKRKETIVEAKDEAFKLKSEADKEIKDRRAEITRQERRMDRRRRRWTSAPPPWSAKRKTSSAVPRPWKPAWTSWNS